MLDAVASGWTLVDRWKFFGTWTLTGRWALAALAVIGAATGVAIVVGLRRLPKQEDSSPTRKTLISVVGFVLAAVLLFEVLFVIEAIAHVIWPNFVDNGA